MARKQESMKKSEARILIYLSSADHWMRNGKRISNKLEIDYVYLMKLMGQMYDKGWIGTSIYNRITYFRVTLKAPIKEARERMSNEH